MTIIERFLEDHAAFRKHLAQTLASARDLPAHAPPPHPNDNDRIFNLRLRRHARMESELLFPAMQRAGSEETRKKTVQKYITHGNDEHASVAKRQAELQSTSQGAHLIQWRTCLEQFAEGLQRHIAIEETEIFPLAQEILSPALLTELNQKAELVP